MGNSSASKSSSDMSSSASNMSNSGRECAIEALHDMDPRGSLARTTKMLEEASYSALSHRPNLIPTSVFRETIHSLAAAEIVDRKQSNFKNMTSAFEGKIGDNSISDIEYKERVLSHYKETMKKKNQKNPHISPQLILALRKIHGTMSDDIAMKEESVSELEKFIYNHALFKSENPPETTDASSGTHHQMDNFLSGATTTDTSSSTSPSIDEIDIWNLEKLVGDSCEKCIDPSDQEQKIQALQGLLISSISILTTCVLDNRSVNKSPGPFSDNTVFMQVGSILSLLQFTEEDSVEKSDNALDPLIPAEILAYFGNAASEQSDIDSKQQEKPLDPLPVAIEETDISEEKESVRPGIPLKDSHPVTSASAVPIPSSSSSSSDDSEGTHNSSSNSSRSSTASDDDEAAMLQQALALSLEEAQMQENKEEEASVDVALTVEVTDPIVSQEDVEQLSNIDLMLAPDEDVESNQHGVPPTYPYLALLTNTLPKGNLKEVLPIYKGAAVIDTSSFFDTKSSQHFGALPAEHIVVHLIRCALFLLQKSSNSSEDVTPKPYTFPGGVASCAFKSETNAKATEKSEFDSNSVYLLIILLILVTDARIQVLDKLNQIKADEDISRKKLAQASRVERTNRENDDFISLQQEDDPASQILLIEETQKADESTPYELLEEKGLHRKAAAAAESALMREYRKNRRFMLKKAVFTFSRAAYFIMSCLIEIFDDKTTSLALPAPLATMFSSSLESFYDCKKTLISASLSNEQDGNLLLLAPLCHMAITTWAYSIDILHPTHDDQEQLLCAIIRSSISTHEENKISHENSLICSAVKETIVEYPWSYAAQMASMVDALCNKFLSSSSRLDSFIPLPTSVENIKYEKLASQSPTLILNLIGSAVSGNNKFQPLPSSNSLTKLYIALSHRIHCRLFLWGTQGVDLNLDEDSPSFFDSSLQLISASQLTFDSTKCADSIALSKNTAHQRASKTWGTVLSTVGFSPKTGVHSWAVQLDKCEKGHVFVGVTTSQASTRTYVGGDKYGWGVIGTQALWHERSKIRGDYGQSFRTGAIIIVTLDTDAGTLSFGLYKDGSTDTGSSSRIITSTTRRKASVEDWGIAFEGLPLDTKFYPAVGLYQRDDKVTLQSVAKPSLPMGSSNDSTNSTEEHHEKEDILKWNNLLMSFGVSHASSVIHTCIDLMKSSSIKDTNLDHPILTEILPSLMSCLSILPTHIPFLRSRYAINLIPLIVHLIRYIDSVVVDKTAGPYEKMDGKFLVRTKPTEGTPEEYVIDMESRIEKDSHISYGLEGKGQTKNGKNKSADITGTIINGMLYLTEEWSDEGWDKGRCNSVIIEGRLSLKADKFEGHFYHLNSKRTGLIGGVLISEKKHQPNFQTLLIKAETLSCLALSQLCLSLTGKYSSFDFENNFSREINTDYISEFQKSIICSGGLSYSFKDIENELLNRLHFNVAEDGNVSNDEIVCDWNNFLCNVASLDNLMIENDSKFISIDDSLDAWVSKEAGGEGSGLSRLGSPQFSEARRHLISTILSFTDLHNEAVQEKVHGKSPPSLLKNIWQESLSTMESAIRKAIADPTRSRKEAFTHSCISIKKKCNFLLRLRKVQCQESMVVTRKILEFILKTNECDLVALENNLKVSMKKAYLQYWSLSTLNFLIGSNLSVDVAVESALVNLPSIMGFRRHLKNPIHFNENLNDRIEIGRSYLDGIEGSGLESSISEKACELYERISFIISSAIEEGAKNFSLLLSLLSCWCISIRSDFDTVIINTELLTAFKTLLKIHRDYLKKPRNLIEDAEANAVSKVSSAAKWYLGRRVLSSIMGAISIIFSQLALDEHLDSELSTSLLAILEEELTISANWVASSNKEKSLRVSEERFHKDIKLCSNTCLNEEQRKLLFPTVENSTSCKTNAVDHFTEFGAISSGIVNSLGSFGTSNTSVAEILNYNLKRPEQYFSMWLDMLNVMTMQSNQMLKLISNEAWLLDALHISDVIGKNEEYSLPLKFYSRILRILRVILVERKNISFDVVKILFEIAGEAGGAEGELELKNNFQTYFPTDFGQLSRDAVSLLRYLHHFSEEWKLCIEGFLLTHMKLIYNFLHCSESPSASSVSACSRGCLAFLGGTPQSLCIGTCVLVKPAQNSSSSSLSKSSHLAGASGAGYIESIVNGLTRRTASAGFVTNIDKSNQTCEVVLFQKRNMFFKHTEPTKRSSLVSNHMTIRVVRASSNEIVCASEIPLKAENYLSDIIKLILPAAVEKISSLVVDDEYKQADDPGAGSITTYISSSCIRASLITMSDKTLLNFLIQDLNVKKALSKLLNIASKVPQVCFRVSKKSTTLESMVCESLSSLPSYEAQFMQLRHVLSQLQNKSKINSLSHSLKWDYSYLVAESTFSAIKEQYNLKGDEALTANVQSDDKTSYNTPTSNLGMTSSSHLGMFTSSGTSGGGEDGESVSTADTNSAAHHEGNQQFSSDNEDASLREAAIAQMAELGLPRSWAEFALRRTGGTNVEAAVHFCLERGGDMERLLAAEQDREGSSRDRWSASGASGSNSAGANLLIRQLLEMGFPSHWCAEALAATRNNVDDALTWILTNGERLSAQDGDAEMSIDEEDDEEDEEDDEEEMEDELANRNNSNESHYADSSHEDSGVTSNVENSVTQESSLDTANVESTRVWNEEKANTNDAGVGSSRNETKIVKGKRSSSQSNENICRNHSWSGSICPLRFVSGRSNIDIKTLEISGLPSGGFSSVGTKGVLLTTGKWYYEAELLTAGCLQIGWADGSFAGHCQADRGDGCGDGPSSWAFDGWRRYRWHSIATEWGCRWQVGDVVGCAVDMDKKIVSFTLNGRGEEIGMGVAFSGEGFRPCGGVYACVSFNRREKLRLFLGGTNSPFKYAPPKDHKGVNEAVLNAVHERKLLIESEEKYLGVSGSGNIYSNTSTYGSEVAKFLCDFSDGEHGHELFAWQHRYYGSDASVHLGKGNSSSNRSGHISSSSSSNRTFPYSTLEDRMEFSRKKLKSTISNTDKKGSLPKTSVLELHKQVLNDALFQANRDFENTCQAIAILYARKLILHIIVTLSNEFSLTCLMDQESSTSESIDTKEIKTARNLWKVLDICCSLRQSGWVGEASAMAIAAEALGLGISSHDSSNSSLHGDFKLPVCSLTQVLTSVMDSPFPSERDFGNSFAASSEAALGGEGGGFLVFLRNGLQSAVGRSIALQHVLTSAVRRAVRILGAVEHSNDSSSNENEDGETSLESKKSEESTVLAPDARLASFFTGLLLSNPVQTAISNDLDKGFIYCELFEAWSVGLLSASAPWRMVCALTASGILNLYPAAMQFCVDRIPTLKRFYNRFHSTVARRVWAERAAYPVCSRYVQALIELLSSIRRLEWSHLYVDAATPLPLLNLSHFESNSTSLKKQLESPIYWETDEGWVCSDNGWEVWTGTLETMAVEWKTPSRSAVRSLMDGGEGPPFLREGCIVVRGLDWDEPGSGSVMKNEDGKDIYEREKISKEKERSLTESTKDNEAECNEDPKRKVNEDENISGHEITETQNMERKTAEQHRSTSAASKKNKDDKKRKKKRKSTNPKLPIGTVLSIEEWNGIPALGRRVRWNLTGIEGVYRYGGDGGRFDLVHVEVNEKSTRIHKRHPLPESSEQCAARHGFGNAKKYNIILRIRRGNEISDDPGETVREGVLEIPDFGAGIRVECLFHEDGAVTITEKNLIYGSKDSGWEARFGQPSYVPGNTIVLSSTRNSGVFSSFISKEKTKSSNDNVSSYSTYEELLGSVSFPVKYLRNRVDGGKLRVTSELRLLRDISYARSRNSSNYSMVTTVSSHMPPPIHFDPEYHASSISLSLDGRTISCFSSEGRGTAFASVGFSKGVHYWEVKLEQADIGSVFVGVAEKPGVHSGSSTSSSSSFSFEGPPRLNRWLGWGFVNFRATYTSGAERVYGQHCHAGDTVGVLLDCDAGRISFFFDGVKYGEHIMNDLGCAYENLSPFGFNADGCGSGGNGQGAPSEGGRNGRYPAANGAVRPRALWPVIGLRSKGDRVTIGNKWLTGIGIDGVTSLENSLSIVDVIHDYEKGGKQLPAWFMKESFAEYERWRSDRWIWSNTRGSGPYTLGSIGLDVSLDSSVEACAAASSLLGLNFALLSGDRVTVKRSSGRLLELQEEALVLGAYQGRLFYKIVSQKSEGGSLTEGGGRAWFWDESEVVDGGVQLIGEGKGLGITLPLLDKFKCTFSGGLKIVYDGGAVLRSDLEIFDGSANVGALPHGTIIAPADVLERRINSAGVVRYRVRFQAIEGWISSRIRGGQEEAIVEPVISESENVANSTTGFLLPEDSVRVWLDEYSKKRKTSAVRKICEEELKVKDMKEFEKLVASSRISKLSQIESDSLLVQAVSKVADFSVGDPLDIPFTEVYSALSFAALTNEKEGKLFMNSSSIGSHHAVAGVLSSIENSQLPSIKAMLAKIALLRALNRRGRMALPWLSLRPAQEGSSVFGGLLGYGASVVRVGRSSIPHEVNKWVSAPSIASRLRKCRSLFFTSVKKTLLESIVNSTTTPTPLSHDEYELPREVRTVRVNRLKARRVMSSQDMSLKRKYSVFAQLQHEMRGWSGAALRRGFCAKGHGGQKRAFKVKLIGEGVNDYSGPYREVFTDSFREISELGILVPTPNNVNEVGNGRDLLMFASNTLTKDDVNSNFDTNEERCIRRNFSTAINNNDDMSREIEDALVFLGKLTGTACRHGILVDLPLPKYLVWYKMAEENINSLDAMREIDLLESRSFEQESDSKTRYSILATQQRMLNFFAEGISSVLPTEVFSIFNGSELEDVICGNPDVDVDLLQRIVEYEGYKTDDLVISFFWETLREMTSDERKQFLQFVWARNRLPMKACEFEAPFKIIRDTKSLGVEPNALPSASTCFFSLTLPEYKSKETLQKKLMFAIKNVTTMESDYVTNEAEVSEGWRGL